MMNKVLHWTDEEVNKLMKCVSKEVSKEELQNAFPNRSYPAIIGKIHRLGLQYGTNHISEDLLKRFVNDINRLCIVASEYCIYEYDLKKIGDESYTINQIMRRGGFCSLAIEVSKREMFRVLKDIRDTEVRAAKLKYNEYETQLNSGNMDYLRQQFTLLKSCIETLERY